MKSLEFEKKFVLNIFEKAKILEVIHHTSYRKYSICQAYVDKKDRIRAINQGPMISYTFEPKSGLDLGTDYAVAVEKTPLKLTKEEFEDRLKNASRSLIKDRYELYGMGTLYKYTMDVFYDPQFAEPYDYFSGSKSANLVPYAMVLEAELVLDVNTRQLDLSFVPPKALEPFVIKYIDDSDPLDKVFSSYNLCVQNYVTTMFLDICRELAGK